jgi:hypothetical protein
VIAQARDTFLLEQQRQHLSPRARRAFAHPVNEVLAGVLRRQCGTAGELLDVCEVVLGARAPRILSDWAGVDLLAVEPIVPAEHGREVAELELTPDREPLLFTGDQVAAAGALLERVGDRPVPLAELVEAAHGPAEAHALALLALAHRSPELGTLHGQGAREALLAVPADHDDAITSPALTLVRVPLGEPDDVPEPARSPGSASAAARTTRPGAPPAEDRLEATG